MILGGSAEESEASSDEQLQHIKSVSFVSADTVSSDNNNVGTCLSDSDRTKHQAAVKLQKTYKSFRTRRQLADCAVLVEQRWWKLLDFVELKHSSISFFEIHHPETAVSRWTRARTKASKVGKGLSKDDKARKLALQHWLEAIDPRHRYGHNLQFYYINWLHCDSTQPFFYWLDIGDGREVSLERCTRSKLQQQCIKYLGPSERSAYEVVITDGKFMYKQSGELLDTTGGPDDVKWIFVLSVSKVLYVGQKKKGTFQHSSFLAGGATLSAGRLEVEKGVLKAVWPHSGHYLPTEENFQEFVAFMRQHDVDLTVVQSAPSEEDELFHNRLPISLSMPELRQANDVSAGEDAEDRQKPKDDEDAHNHHHHNHHHHHHHHHHQPISRWSRKLQSKIALLQIPKGQDVFEMFVTPRPWSNAQSFDDSDSDDGYETPDEYLSDSEFSVSKHNLFDRDEGEEEYEEASIPKDVILSRINSHQGMKSYQLAHQLSCRWTTGAGPRIGCLRDYPSKLQFRVLEDASLSPRSVHCSRTRMSVKNPNLTGFCRDKSPLAAADSSDVSAQSVMRSSSDC